MRILRQKPPEKTYLDFKKSVKSIQTATYNGARTAYIYLNTNLATKTKGMFSQDLEKNKCNNFQYIV